jgi:hypothetical protein
MLIEKLFMIVTTLSLATSAQLLIDIPGQDFPDIKDVPGFMSSVSVENNQY